MQTIQFNDLTFYVRDNSWDENVARGVATHLYGLKPHGVVVDIGAHIGSFCIPASKVADKVIAFEPSPDNYKVLLKNIQANDVSVEVHNVALGVPGERDLHFYQRNTGMTTLFPQKRDNQKIESTKKDTVTVISLDEALKDIDVVDVMKIDCEGGEYEFLPNASQETFDKIKSIVLELHKGEQDALIQFLRGKFTSVKVKNSDAKGCKIVWLSK